MDHLIDACRYQHFLESVLEVADEYQEVSDLLLRHATLSATNADLKEHQRKYVSVGLHTACCICLLQGMQLMGYSIITIVACRA